jgi:hypothetical protein
MTLQTEHTEQNRFTSVSFDNISLSKLLFSETYRLSRGSASQLILGFKYMLSKLGEGTNDYQKTIYPHLRIITQEIIDLFEKIFLTQTNPIYKQVFGANLNGSRNDGSLYRSINSSVNRSLTYNYAQFGQLLKVLTNRLQYISQRDPQLIERYKNSSNEMGAYLELQKCATTFLEILDEQNEKWTACIHTSRSMHNIQPSQYQIRIKRNVPGTEKFTQVKKRNNKV